MADDKLTPAFGFGGFLLLGGAAALTYALWPKSAAGAPPARVPTPGSSAGGSTSPSQPGATATTPTTAPEELGWTAADYYTPASEVAPGGPTWYLPGGQTGPSWYNGLGDFSAADDPRPVQYMQLADRVRYAQSKINDAYNGWHSGVYTWLVGGHANIAQMVSSSNDTANAIVAALYELAGNPDVTYPDGARKDRAIVDVAVRWSSNASGIIQQMKATSFLAEEWDFIKRFPESFRTVVNWTADTVTSPLTPLAWGISKPVLIVGGALALLAFMLSRAGVSVNAGPVKVKAKE